MKFKGLGIKLLENKLQRNIKVLSQNLSCRELKES